MTAPADRDRPSRFEGFAVRVYIPEVMRPHVAQDIPRAAAAYLGAIIDALGVETCATDDVKFSFAWGPFLRVSFSASPSGYCAPERDVLVSEPAFWTGVLCAVSSMLQMQARELQVIRTDPQA